jgi:hypothetical protein
VEGENGKGQMLRLSAIFFAVNDCKIVGFSFVKYSSLSLYCSEKT